MAFPEAFIEELVSRSEISDVVGSYVALTKRSGSNIFGLCPFHNEKTPSFSVSTDKQIYHCFGCGKGGGVINFIMEIENLSYPDAVRFLARRAGMEVPEDGEYRENRTRDRILKLNRDAARYYYKYLRSPEGKPVADYLASRRISGKVARDFGMGAAPDSWDSLLKAMTAMGYEKRELLDAGLAVKNAKGGIYDRFRNRLMLPVINVRGEIIGFGSRVIDKSEPKYLNSPENVVYSKRRALYGLNIAKNSKRPNIILCEGNLDVVTLHQAGFDNAVASMGTALTTEQTRLLARYTKELVICYDNDEAGQKATARALEVLKDSELSVKVLRLPNIVKDGVSVKQDADDFIKNHGADAFEALLSGSGTSAQYGLAVIAAKYDFSLDDHRVEFLKEASRFIAGLTSPVEREIYSVRAAEQAKVSPDVMKQEVNRAIKSRAGYQKKKQTQMVQSPDRNAQPKERTIRYENIRSARAEEGIIRLLLMEYVRPELCDIEPEEFSSPFLAKTYRIIKTRLSEGRPVSMDALTGQLESEEISRLTALLQQPENSAAAEGALRDYIGAVKRESLKRAAEESGDLRQMYLNAKENKHG
ncbi:MAG: DNA primase [Oscillospiraceae bacterium]|nr:DNA primase [Oscillospiraceae bacterium]